MRIPPLARFIFISNWSRNLAALQARAFRFLGLGALFFFASCATPKVIPPKVPQGTRVASNFDPERFEGRWYQIARIPNIPEAGTTMNTSSFSRNPNGTWDIYDMAWNNAAGRWIGKNSTTSKILPEATFISPGSFIFKKAPPRHVLVVDAPHRFALVSGPDHRTLWLLSKDASPDEGRVHSMLEQAKGLGFPIEQITFLPLRD
jgi:apolipoprotein D and lipocalin family protein